MEATVDNGGYLNEWRSSWGGAENRKTGRRPVKLALVTSFCPFCERRKDLAALAPVPSEGTDYFFALAAAAAFSS